MNIGEIVGNLFSNFFSGFLKNIIGLFPEEYKVLGSLLFYILFIGLYSIFIWKFHKLLSDREIIKLNLKKYEDSRHSRIEKSLIIVLFTIEYIILLPFLVLFWFIIFSIFLLILSESGDANHILLISSAIIVSIRIVSYVDENLSRSLAKILPLTLLAIFVTGPNFFNLEHLFLKFSQTPFLLKQMLTFIVFIFVIEFVLRLGYAISELFGNFYKKERKNISKEEIIKEVSESATKMKEENQKKFP